MSVDAGSVVPKGGETVDTAWSTDGMSSTAPEWAACRFLTCSVLPVRSACNLSCPFCFSKSSISALRHDAMKWQDADLDAYFRFARSRGAARLVITGGGEPLLRPDDVCHIVARGRSHFDEIACFTNGSRLTRDLARRLETAGLSYLCYSRHHYDDDACRALMGAETPRCSDVLAVCGSLPVRATCVMTRGAIDSESEVWTYMRRLARFGVREFTFKHTYVAYESSVFGDSVENTWARRHRVHFDPFTDQGTVLARLPWGPAIRRIGPFQVCYYHEPTPAWEKEHRLCRSINMLSDGTVYASLEDQSSRLFRLSS